MSQPVKVSSTPRSKQKERSIASSAPVWGHNAPRPAAPRIRPRDAPSQQSIPDFFLPPSPAEPSFTPQHIPERSEPQVQISRSLSMSYTNQRADIARFRIQAGLPPLDPSSHGLPPAPLGRTRNMPNHDMSGFVVASSPTIMSVLQLQGSGLPQYPSHRFSGMSPSTSIMGGGIFAQAQSNNTHGRHGSSDLQTPSPTEVGSAPDPDGDLQFDLNLGDMDDDSTLATDLDNLSILY